MMKKAVLVIDVQNGLFETGEKPFEADEVIKRINKITSRARELNLPVIFIQHTQKKGLLTEGSHEWEIHKDLIVNKTDIKINKTTPDSFLKTELQNYLLSNNIEELIICGYASEFCVDTTTRKAAALGYSVYLVGDAHTTHDKNHASGKQIREHHNATLPDLTSFDAKISLVNSSDLSFM